VQVLDYVSVFKALANEHRLKIYQILSNCCTPGTQCSVEEALAFCVGELHAQLDIAPSTLSQHLKELHHAGLVNMQRNGKQIYCSINTEMMANIQHLFSRGSNDPKTSR